jgi:NAD(P)-dependent dehydrogenase (short-subunit alcohol dehydrogenase family)
MSVGVALITGCSSGIGRELAQQLTALSWTVYAGARRPESIASMASSQLIPVELDVNNPLHLRQVAERIQNNHGRLDLLVNNAGYGAMGPVVEMPLKELKRQFETNVFAPIALVQTLLPLLRRTHGARVVNIGSVSGILTTPFSGAYCASKAALHTLSDALRMELAPFGIQVITIQPGAIESEFGNNAAHSLMTTLPKKSLYNALKPYIEKRAHASQNRPTPAAAFVKEMVATITQPKVPAVKRIGTGSTLLPLLKQAVPEKWLDQILGRSFGLNKRQD